VLAAATLARAALLLVGAAALGCALPDPAVWGSNVCGMLAGAAALLAIVVAAVTAMGAGGLSPKMTTSRAGARGAPRALV
jgi:hypothetical protein